jgi:hypothetical protein
MNTDISDFNLWHMSDYGRNVFLVAGRFFDLAPDRWEFLTCCWYGRNGLSELKDDRYLTETSIRFKSVDALVAETDPKLNDIGAHLYKGWMAKKALLAERRKTPPVIVLPPDPIPPEPKPQPKPEPKPSPEPSKPQNGDTQQPRKKLPWKLIATVLAAVAFGLKFTPVPAAVLLGIEWLIRLLNAIPG